MLLATRRLLDLHRGAPTSWLLLRALARVVCERGGADDVPPLVERICESPDTEVLLAPVMAHGGQDDVARLYARCVSAGDLREDWPASVLHALGYLGFEPAREVLLRHALRPVDWSRHISATLGLLHLPLGDAAAQVREGILECRGKNLFPELLPALAAQTGDEALRDVLFELGATTASTDCNGGLILGLALYGESGRGHFQRVIDNPRWEAWSGSTGSRWYAWLGTRALGIRCAELAERLRTWARAAPDARPASEALAHNAEMVLAMIECRLRGDRSFVRAAEALPDETIEGLLEAAFQWTTPHGDDSLTDALHAWFGPDAALTRHAYELRRLAERALLSELRDAEVT